MSGVEQARSELNNLQDGRLQPGKIVTFLYRRVHHLLIPKRIVTLFAQQGYLGNQFPAFFTE
ncbi:MAG: hypothetical protein JJE30_01150 [Desulfuromonadales bacterium]|nr:hypothetical protein [Desulfuromonadales bacterium]